MSDLGEVIKVRVRLTEEDWSSAWLPLHGGRWAWPVVLLLGGLAQSMEGAPAGVPVALRWAGLIGAPLLALAAWRSQRRWARLAFERSGSAEHSVAFDAIGVELASHAKHARWTWGQAWCWPTGTGVFLGLNGMLWLVPRRCIAKQDAARLNRLLRVAPRPPGHRVNKLMLTLACLYVIFAACLRFFPVHP